MTVERLVVDIVVEDVTVDAVDKVDEDVVSLHVPHNRGHRSWRIRPACPPFLQFALSASWQFSSSGFPLQVGMVVDVDDDVEEDTLVELCVEAVDDVVVVVVHVSHSTLQVVRTASPINEWLQLSLVSNPHTALSSGTPLQFGSVIVVVPVVPRVAVTRADVVLAVIAGGSVALVVAAVGPVGWAGVVALDVMPGPDVLSLGKVAVVSGTQLLHRTLHWSLVISYPIRAGSQFCVVSASHACASRLPLHILAVDVVVDVDDVVTVVTVVMVVVVLEVRVVVVCVDVVVVGHELHRTGHDCRRIVQKSFPKNAGQSQNDSGTVLHVSGGSSLPWQYKSVVVVVVVTVVCVTVVVDVVVAGSQVLHSTGHSSWYWKY